MQVLEQATNMFVQDRENNKRSRMYRDDPVLWAEEYLGVHLWSKQKEILYSIRDNRKTAVAAGHGVGKSYVAAIAMAWWIDTHPLEPDENGGSMTFVASTAPFADQISAILWNNLRILHSLSKIRHEEYNRRLTAGEELGEYKYVTHSLPGYITGDNKWKTDDGLLVGQGRKPPDNKTDSGYQGLHARYLLAIGDEAAGLNKDMIDALGNITTGEHNRMLLIANPTDPTSAMAQIWKRKDKNWARMHISVFDSPAVTGETVHPAVLEAVSGWTYIEEKRSEWGEDDPRWASRVLGQWAFDAGENLYTEVDLTTAANTVVVPYANSRPIDGWDIARVRDNTVGYRALKGEVYETDPETGEPTVSTGRVGYKVRKIGEWNNVPLTGNDPENPGTATRIDRIARADGVPTVVVDSVSIGAGVLDGFKEIQRLEGASYNVLEYYGNGATTDRRMFVNARAEHHMGLKKLMHQGVLDLDGMDEALFDDLRGIKTEYKAGVLKIESKEEMKKRGLSSPDNSDAAIYCLVPYMTPDETDTHPTGQKLLQDPLTMLDEVPAYLSAMTNF